MSNPLHAKYYADEAVCQRVAIVENVQLARDTFRVRLECPELARRIVPGQFVMVRLADHDDPLLGRPLALYDTVLDDQDNPIGIDVVYLVLGKMTTRLARFVPGQELEIWGPLGNGFSPQPCDHLVMVAGGIGQTPFMALAREQLGGRSYGDPPRTVEPVVRATLCYGARSSDLLAGVADFESTGMEVRISTDDGSAGHHGLVTEELQGLLAGRGLEESTRIVCCGPEPMMEAVSQLAADFDVPCQVSLETPMACGIGICFSCVAKVRDTDGNWDYKRTCVDGPIFDAEQIVW